MNVFTDDTHVQGRLSADDMILPADAVSDSQVSTAVPIQASKLVHQHQVVYSQKHGTAVATERMPVHLAVAAGTLVSVSCGCVVANIGAATVVVNVLKNGTTVLSGTITIDDGDAAFAVLAGSVSVGPYVANDVFEVSVTATAGGGTLGQGLFVCLVLRENPGP